MNRRRPAFSLIELTSVLTVLSLVWLAITSTLYTLYRADNRVRDELRQQQALDRFAMKLRRDTHSAKAASIESSEENNQELVLEFFSKPTVRYRFADGNTHRVVTADGETIAQDTFGLDAAGVSFAVSESDRSWLVTAEIKTRDRRSNATRIQQVKAAVPSVAIPSQPEAEAAP